jgi:release factor glutamine methyltransferase
VANAKREATALWAALEQVTPGNVWLKRGAEPAQPVSRRFWEAVRRRASGVPFAYAVGRVAFRTLDLAIDSRALIPRPETEGLVELILQRGTGGLAADIGTGSGCIALSLAVEGSFDRVVAVERAPAAATLACENVALVQPRTPVEIRAGNLLAPLGDNGERYRVIVSNPPYLTADEYATLDPAVRQYEPAEALVSGSDGLAVTRALCAGAPALLEPGGMLALEIDERRADAVRALAHEHGWARIGIHDDLFGRPRYALAFREGD